jgi:hypothetical protein
MEYEPRKELTYTTSLIDLLATMAEGNPGALNVLAAIAQSQVEDAMLIPLHLDDMNIRGTQIWVGYKDYCKQDLKKFMEAARSRDEGMVEVINNVGRQGNHRHKAVTSGASYGNAREYLA